MHHLHMQRHRHLYEGITRSPISETLSPSTYRKLDVMRKFISMSLLNSKTGISHWLVHCGIPKEEEFGDFVKDMDEYIDRWTQQCIRK